MTNSSQECVIVVPEVVAFGGAERSVLALAHWLFQRAIPHRILMYYDHINLARHAAFPLSMTMLHPGRGVINKVIALRRYLYGHSSSGCRPLMSGYQAALHASLAGSKGFHTLMHDTPSLFSDHDQMVSLGQKARRTLAKFALRRGMQSGGRAIVTSEYLAAETLQLYGCRADIIRMGGMSDPSVFRPRKVEKILQILSVSRLESNKRIDWIIRGLAQLESQNPKLSSLVDWSFDVVGDGAMAAELKALSFECGVSARVRFHGFVDDATVSELFHKAHLFVMPSRQGYGIPAIEALSRGVPVLLHRESGVSDILRNTPWCVVADGGEDKMVAALDQAIQSARQNRHVNVPLPNLPTEAFWAESVARACGWVPKISRSQCLAFEYAKPS